MDSAKLAVMGECFSCSTLSTEKSGSHTAGVFVLEDLQGFYQKIDVFAA